MSRNILSRSIYSAAKIYPETFNSSENRNNPNYISSDSDEESKETHICGIAINIDRAGQFPKLNKISIDEYFEKEKDNEDEEEKNFIDDSQESRFADVCYRSYSVASTKDDWNIRHGRCPDYALEWSHEFNRKHWPLGHDYINGHQDSPSRDEFTEECCYSYENEMTKSIEKLNQIFT